MEDATLSLLGLTTVQTRNHFKMQRAALLRPLAGDQQTSKQQRQQTGPGQQVLRGGTVLRQHHDRPPEHQRRPTQPPQMQQCPPRGASHAIGRAGGQFPSPRGGPPNDMTKRLVVALSGMFPDVDRSVVESVLKVCRQRDASPSSSCRQRDVPPA